MSPFFFLFWRQQNKYFGYKRPPHPAPLHPPGPAACLPQKAIPFVGQGGSFAAPPAAAPSRSRSPTSRGHPPRAACALPAVAAHLPSTCRAGVHTRRDPAPLCSPGSPAAPGLAPHPNTPTHRRRARLHDIHPSQPTIGDHPGKRS